MGASVGELAKAHTGVLVGGQGGESAAAGVLDIAGRVDICQANTLIN